MDTVTNPEAKEHKILVAWYTLYHMEKMVKEECICQQVLPVGPIQPAAFFLDRLSCELLLHLYLSLHGDRVSKYPKLAFNSLYHHLEIWFPCLHLQSTITGTIGNVASHQVYGVLGHRTQGFVHAR